MGAAKMTNHWGIHSAKPETSGQTCGFVKAFPTCENAGRSFVTEKEGVLDVHLGSKSDELGLLVQERLVKNIHGDPRNMTRSPPW